MPICDLEIRMLPEPLRTRALIGFVVLLLVTIFATPWRYQFELNAVAKIANRSYGVTNDAPSLSTIHRPFLSRPDKETLVESGVIGEFAEVSNVEINVPRLLLYWAGIAIATIAAIAIIPYDRRNSGKPSRTQTKGRG